MKYFIFTILRVIYKFDVYFCIDNIIAEQIKKKKWSVIRQFTVIKRIYLQRYQERKMVHVLLFHLPRSPNMIDDLRLRKVSYEVRVWFPSSPWRFLPWNTNYSILCCKTKLSGSRLSERWISWQARARTQDGWLQITLYMCVFVYRCVHVCVFVCVCV